MTNSRLTRRLTAIFKPPFEGLGIVVWLYFVLCFLIHPRSAILQGTFTDPDDYTILTMTIDWLKGQSWFDVIQHRLNPPDGVVMHYSRLMELPLAGLIQLFRAAGLDWVPAATVTAAIWPPILFAFFLAALRWLAEPFLPRDWTRATAFVALFATPLLFHFSPGRVDHHGLALLITAMSLGCTVRMLQEPEKTIWGIGAGFFMALGMAIALETLPWLLLMSAFIGLWMMITGRPAARTGLMFGVSLYVISACCLIVMRAFSLLLVPDPLSFSVVYVILAGSIAVCCAAVALAAQSRFIKLRYFMGIGAGLISSVLFFTKFPELATGPFGAINVKLSTIESSIMENVPLIKDFKPLAMVLLPLIGLFASYFSLRTEKSERLRGSWLLIVALLITAYLLSLFYLIRIVSYAILFSIIPLTAFLHQSLAKAKENWRGRKLAAVEFGLILLVGPLPAVLVPAIEDGRPFNTGVLLFPVQNVSQPSNMTALKILLNLPSYNTGKPLTIINALNDGAQLLFYTPHQVIAAPYHNNVTGLLDSTRFLATHDPEEAHKIAVARSIDLVVLDNSIADVYRGKSSKKVFVRNGKIEPDPTTASFAEQLITGQTPDWLKPVDLVLPTSYLLFKVKH